MYTVQCSGGMKNLVYIIYAPSHKLQPTLLFCFSTDINRLETSWDLMIALLSSLVKQGKVHLEMRLNEVITENGSLGQHLLVRWVKRYLGPVWCWGMSHQVLYFTFANFRDYLLYSFIVRSHLNFHTCPLQLLL